MNVILHTVKNTLAALETLPDETRPTHAEFKFPVMHDGQVAGHDQPTPTAYVSFSIQVNQGRKKDPLTGVPGAIGS